MKEFKMHELNKNDACYKRRDFAKCINDAKSENYEKAASSSRIIDDVLTGKIALSELQENVEQAFLKISYKSEEQRALNVSDTTKEIKRYLSCEKRQLQPAEKMSVVLTPEMSVLVAPNYWVLSDDTLEVIKLKHSKPTLTQAQAEEDLALYSMLVYADNMAAAMKGVKHVKASYYFLKKKNDSHSLEHPNFDHEFFETSGGCNIVSLSDEAGIVYTKTVMAPKLEAFMSGIPAHECTKKDCERCPLIDICKYEEPPMVLVKEPVVKSASSICLTDSQIQAIEYEKGVCRINAGAGAGKTMIVALRVATLINKGFKPEDFLLITFTNAGAEEMRNRIALYLSDFGIDADVSTMQIKTFNAFGDDLVKAEYKNLGFSAPPTVIDDVERSHIIAEMINEAIAKPYILPNGKPGRNPLKALNWRRFTADDRYCKGALVIAKKIFDIMKTHNLSQMDWVKIKAFLGTDYRFFSNDETIKLIARLYDEYEDRMRNENLIEFSDQEALVFETLHNDPYYFEKYNIKHIIIDEFQDTSESQIQMVKYFVECPSFESLMVVGDDAQSIYGSLRGTSPKYMIDFEQYIGQKIDDIYLVENHRSTPEIIEFANKINANNVYRVIKDLVATRPSGKPVTVKGFFTPDEEREYVINGIKEHLQNGTKPEDIAVLCYSRTELQEMAGRLNKENIASVMLNPEPYAENPRVRAALALSRAYADITDEKDITVYSNAYIGGGMISMTEEEIDAIDKITNEKLESLRNEKDYEKKKEIFMDMLKDINHEDEVFEKFMEILERKPFPRILEYMEEFTLYGAKNAIRRDHTYPGVVLTTAHSSKGLEWPVCYNMVSKYHDVGLPTKGEAVEERRRLLFVSSTRARDELYITGQYTAFGKRGSYVYNKYLVEAFHAIGETFEASTIEQERELREIQAKQDRMNKKIEKLSHELELRKKTEPEGELVKALEKEIEKTVKSKEKLSA